MFSDKIIEILNKDPRSNPALIALKDKAIEFNLTLAQYEKAREIIMLSLMKDNKEILDAYWEEFGAPMWKEAHQGGN